MTSIAPVNSVQELLAQLEAITWTHSEHAHVRVWFRGQSSTDWNLVPGVYRPDFPANTEETRLHLERHLSQDFRIRSGGLLRNPRDSIDLYFLQQHYGMPTRLLDWTNNGLAALYFAVANREHWSVDGAVFVVDAYQFKGTRGIATSHWTSFQHALSRITSWDDTKTFPSDVIPVRQDLTDLRMSLQRAGFTFHVPDRPALDEGDNPTITKFDIVKSAKQSIREQLSLLGIDASSIFGDLDGLSTTLKNPYGIT